MTKKTSRREKGITLIALIVTIIVLLILAGVTINLAVNNQGIFNKAKTATTAYKNASENEQTGLDEADKEIEKYMPKEGTEGGSGSESGGGTTPTPTTSNLSTTEQTALAQNGMAELTSTDIDNDTDLTSDQKTALKDTTKVKAVLTGNVPVPEGYTYVEGTATTESTAPNSYGVVIKDGSNNEWVWVPVNDAESIAPSGAFETISEIRIASRTKYPSVAQLLTKIASLNGLNGLRIASSSSSSEETSGETVNTTVTKKSKTILSGVTRSTPDDDNDYREPALVTDYDLNPDYYTQAGNFTSAQEFADAMVTDYYNMITSITKYGGFYVGRYELSGTNNGSNSQITNAKVRAGQAPMDHVNWYRLYQANRSFGKSSTTSTMIWGSQWDIVCLWASKVGNKVAYDSSDSSRHSDSYSAKTGSNENDKRNNVYDLEGSRMEWTQEAKYNCDRAFRGGDSHYYYSASNRNNGYPLGSSGYNGSRPTLYIK